MRYEVVFLDRDGVINRMRHDYVRGWQDVEFLPGALEAIGRLTRSGRQVIVATNQSAIAQGLVSSRDVNVIHRQMAAAVAATGGMIRAFLVCPHGAADGCTCRKPAPGLFLRARDELGVRLENAIMIGDQLWDLEAARAAGVGAILVDPDGSRKRPDHLMTYAVVANLAEAADIVCDG